MDWRLVLVAIDAVVAAALVIGLLRVIKLDEHLD